MRDYNEIVNRYLGYLERGDTRNQVMGQFKKLGVPEDIKELIRYSILYKFYGTSARKFIEADEEKAEYLNAIVNRVYTYEPDRFNLAMVALNHVVSGTKKGHQEILAFIEKCNPSDYNKILKELIDADSCQTRKLMVGIESSVSVTCSVCGETKKLHEMRFGRDACLECTKKINNSEGRTTIKEIKRKARDASKDSDREVISQFVSGETAGTVTDGVAKENISRVSRIASLRSFYSEVCNNLLSELSEEDFNSEEFDSKLDKIEFTNKLIMEAIR